MSDKRTVVKGVQVNVFSDGNLGLMMLPGTTMQDAIGILHAATGMAVRQEIQALTNGGEKKRVIVPPAGAILKGKGL